jgi:hypothetical protein
MMLHLLLATSAPIAKSSHTSLRVQHYRPWLAHSLVRELAAEQDYTQCLLDGARKS